jgi:hypothetical protein
MDDLTFSSSRNGSKLRFSGREDRGGEISFDVLVETDKFSGRTRASTFCIGALSATFSEMAGDWRGC